MFCGNLCLFLTAVTFVCNHVAADDSVSLGEMYLYLSLRAAEFLVNKCFSAAARSASGHAALGISVLSQGSANYEPRVCQYGPRKESNLNQFDPRNSRGVAFGSTSLKTPSNNHLSIFLAKVLKFVRRYAAFNVCAILALKYFVSFCNTITEIQNYLFKTYSSSPSLKGEAVMTSHMLIANNWSMFHYHVKYVFVLGTHKQRQFGIFSLNPTKKPFFDVRCSPSILESLDFVLYFKVELCRPDFSSFYGLKSLISMFAFSC